VDASDASIACGAMVPEISKANAVNLDRRISLHIFADVWLVDKSCEGGVFLTGVTELVYWSYSATDRGRKNRNELEYEGKVDTESLITVRRR
jgi:hypothetical protein